MNNLSELKSILGEFLDWNNARLTCFSKMLIALFAVRSVNLREIAVAFAGNALLDSKYKRLKRFFAQFTFDQTAIAKWTFDLFFWLTFGSPSKRCNSIYNWSNNANYALFSIASIDFTSLTVSYFCS